MTTSSEELIDILDDIRRWVKLLGIEEARSKLRNAISSKSQKKELESKMIFHLTNGDRTGSEIASLAEVSQSTVSRRHREWAELGLLEKREENQPYDKLITLQEAGLDVPEIQGEDDNNDNE